MGSQLVTMSVAETIEVGKILAESGFFHDARGAAQAVAKILAGQELGFGPLASMTGIHIVRGKVVVGANLLAAAIKRSGKYDYVVRKLDDQLCVITFRQVSNDGWVEIGESSFSRADARAAGLNGDNWKKYPRNMLFARAISNGARWFTPDVLGGGPVYTPDEMGLAVDDDNDTVVDYDTPTTDTSDVRTEYVSNPIVELRDAANARLKELAVEEQYNAPQHMLNVLRRPEFFGEDFRWPTAPSGAPGWPRAKFDELLAALVDYKAVEGGAADDDPDGDDLPQPANGDMALDEARAWYQRIALECERAGMAVPGLPKGGDVTAIQALGNELLEMYQERQQQELF